MRDLKGERIDVPERDPVAGFVHAARLISAPGPRIAPFCVPDSVMRAQLQGVH